MFNDEVLDRFGDLVATIGSKGFSVSFFQMFSKLLSVEECTVFLFPASEQPKQLVIEGSSESSRIIALELASDYVAGGYLGDPNVRRIAGAKMPSVYATSSRDISDTDYRNHYYTRSNLNHELVLLGRAGNALYYSSFYRRDARFGFGDREIATMGSLSNLVLKALHRHNELTESTRPIEPTRLTDERSPSLAEDRENSLLHMKKVLLAGPHALSAREAEVCSSIVLGYSTLAISLKCGISSNTVATHRKRAYAKLGISSQNELFSRYFRTVRDYEARALS